MKEKKQFLEAGKIVNTHGIRGEVKIEPWCDSPDFFCKLKRIYIDGAEIKIKSARKHGNLVISSLDGFDDIDSAIRLKNKIIFLRREDIKLPKGSNFVQDIIGLDAVDDQTGEKLGVIGDVLSLPAGQVYEIRGDRTILVPAVPDFVISTDIEAGEIRFKLIEGM